MPNNVFLACFLACLLAFVIVALVAWQLGGWFVGRAFRSMGITRQTMTFGGGATVSAGTDEGAPIQVDRPWTAGGAQLTPAEIATVQAKMAAEHDQRYAEFVDEMRAVVLMGAHLAKHTPPPTTLSENEMLAWNNLIANARIALDEQEARTQAEQQQAKRGEPTKGTPPS